MTKWVCTVCGYVYEGDAAPAECPVCHVGADKFKKVEGDLTLAAEHEYGVYAKTVKNNPEISDEDKKYIFDQLKANFDGECSEVGMYLCMARIAHREGYPEVGLYWEKAAYEEAEHAAKFAEMLGEDLEPNMTSSTKKNLAWRVDCEYGATAGKVDLVISGMNPTEERAKVVDFSEVYYNSKHGILVRAEDADKYQTFADLEGAKVGVQLGSTQEKIAKTEIPNVNLQQLSNINNLILELKAGKVDAIVMEKPVAEMAVKSNPELAVGKPIYEEQTGGNAVGIAKNNPQLLAKVNEVITELNESGKMDEYIAKANELAATANIVEE